MLDHSGRVKPNGRCHVSYSTWSPPCLLGDSPSAYSYTPVTSYFTLPMYITCDMIKMFRPMSSENPLPIINIMIIKLQEKTLHSETFSLCCSRTLFM